MSFRHNNSKKTRNIQTKTRNIHVHVCLCCRHISCAIIKIILLFNYDLVKFTKTASGIRSIILPFDTISIYYIVVDDVRSI